MTSESPKIHNCLVVVVCGWSPTGVESGHQQIKVTAVAGSVVCREAVRKSHKPAGIAVGAQCSSAGTFCGNPGLAASTEITLSSWKSPPTLALAQRPACGTFSGFHAYNHTQ